VGYDDGRISSYHTDGHVFDLGLEYDSAMVGKVPLFPNYRQLVAGSILQMPFAENTIGSIVAIHVLDHVSDLGSALTEIARVLKPEGKCLFSLFSKSAVGTVGADSLASFDLHNFLDRTEWESLLSKHGMKLDVYKEFTFSHHYLRAYFFGMKGLIPHDRSIVFQFLWNRLPTLSRFTKSFLRRATYAAYWESYSQQTNTSGGCNLFFVAQKIVPHVVSQFA
jgi:ubiquinone/menaquinone biosynthesis C-methylase UbiE